ncbi:MAG: nucleotidyltransferase family protein [Candidatus Omnitrophica bacterium]|nr:nucleotidyltransferase family protein [Candidatus Omnitrophota bacterium]
MKSLILAAGYGTRLASIAENTPKPLLPVSGKPLINYIVDKLPGLPGLNELFVVTNQKFEKHFQDWAKEMQKTFPVPITIVNDGTTTPENRLGSVGDIDFAIKKAAVKDDLFVLGGDNLFDYHLKDFVAFASDKNSAVTIGLYDIHNLKDATMYGVVELGAGGAVVSFEEKPAQPKSTLISMCCYYFPAETLSYLDQYRKASGKMDKAGEYIRWLSEEKEVCGFTFSGKWYDIGSIESYKEAQEKFK